MNWTELFQGDLHRCDGGFALDLQALKLRVILLSQRVVFETHN